MAARRRGAARRAGAPHRAPAAANPGDGHTAALLHDIGKLIISRYLSRRARGTTYAREHEVTWSEADAA